VDDLPIGLTPWADATWRESVLAWVGERLRERGAQLVGQPHARITARSVTLQIETDRETVWFKASPPGAKFEPVLAEALSRWVPGQVLVPLAIDADRGWLLLPDGGTVLGLVPGVDIRSWEEPLRQYAELQRSVASHLAELADLGVPDLRPGRLPGQFDALMDSGRVRSLVDTPGGLTGGQYAALRALRPRLVQWCGRLAASAVPLSLDHADLHDHQVFAAQGRYVFFD
jgi:hypothetical protein